MQNLVAAATELVNQAYALRETETREISSENVGWLGLGQAIECYKVA